MYKVKLRQSRFPAQTDEALHNTTVGDVLRNAAARWPAAPALDELDRDGSVQRRWTYASLLEDSERLAKSLLTRYQPGERIAVWAPNVPEWVLMEFALAMAGLVLVTVNPGYQARELRFLLASSRAAGLFLIAEHRGNPMAKIAADVTPDIATLREVVDLADPQALYAAAGSLGSLPFVRPLDAVQIQYTSGSTGTPKAVVLHHRGITNNSRFNYLRSAAPAQATALVYLPLFHTGGCVGAILGPTQFGARMLLAREFKPELMNAVVERELVSLMITVPTLLTAMLDADLAHPQNLSSLRSIGVGGAMVSPDLVRRVRERLRCDLCTVFGQTESSPLLTMSWPDDRVDDLCNTVGQPLPHTELSILGLHDGSVLPLGEVGEICVQGYGLMLGYDRDPVATAKTIDADGWLHTGDLGTIDARGYVRITGRVKEMIIRGGENLFPAEIENMLLEHPAVAEVAVVGVPDVRYGEAAAAFVRSSPGMSFDANALIAHSRAHLAAQKTPSHWIPVDAWPLTGSGKIDKLALQRQFAQAVVATTVEGVRPELQASPTLNPGIRTP